MWGRRQSSLRNVARRMLHFIRERTKSYCSITAIVMPMHSYSLAPRNNFVCQEVDRSQSVNYVLDKHKDLKRNPSECYWARIYVSSPQSNCDLWLIMNEWRVAFITAKHSGNLGTCGADWRHRLMWCYISRAVRFVFISSLRSILKFATHFCDSTSQSVFTVIYYTQLCYDNVFLHADTTS